MGGKKKKDYKQLDEIEITDLATPADSPLDGKN